MVVACPIIIDIVDSRNLPDRIDAHNAVLAAFTTVGDLFSPHREVWPTVGDEFQVVYSTLAHAVIATGLVRLLISEEVDLRFGIGHGEIRTITESEAGPIDDGPGWYSARDALDHVGRMQAHGHPWLRTWVSVSEEADNLSQMMTRAHLTTRDHIISRMNSRERRITAAWLRGSTQSEIARREKMSQAAISQRLVACGATAIAHAQELFDREHS